MITNLSNHIPMFTIMDSIKVATMEVLIFLIQNTWGEITLQVIMIQYAQAYGPEILLRNAYCSPGTPEYQATNNSVMYAIPTIDPVIMITIFINSIWPMVM